ncbi:MAG TPA: hypothetical protein VGI31_03660, partial [Streptosporangiaceae bacterium]
MYQLGRDSTQCVRYDVSAVYLGTPGQDQQCPAHLVGQADTVSITGRTAGGSAAGAAVGAGVGAGAVGAGADDGGGQPVAVHQAAAASALSVSVTYGPDPSLVQQVVDSVRPAGPAGASSVPQSAKGGAGTAEPSAVPQSASAAGVPSAKASASAKPATAASAASAASAAGAHSAGGASAPAVVPSATPAAPSATPASKPSASKPSAAKPLATAAPVPGASKTPQPASTVKLVVRKVMPLPGFDTCTAPSLQAMKAWRKAYSTAAIYIGGTEMGCGYGN